MFPDMKKSIGQNLNLYLKQESLLHWMLHYFFYFKWRCVWTCVSGFSTICSNFVPSLQWLNASKSKGKNFQVTTENNITVVQGCPLRPLRPIVSLSQRDSHMSPIRQRDASDPKRHFVLNRHWCDWWWILWWTVTFSHFPFYIPFLDRHRS